MTLLATIKTCARLALLGSLSSPLLHHHNPASLPATAPPLLLAVRATRLARRRATEKNETEPTTDGAACAISVSGGHDDDAQPDVVTKAELDEGILKVRSKMTRVLFALVLMGVACASYIFLVQAMIPFVDPGVMAGGPSVKWPKDAPWMFALLKPAFWAATVAQLLLYLPGGLLISISDPAWISNFRKVGILCLPGMMFLVAFWCFETVRLAGWPEYYCKKSLTCGLMEPVCAAQGMITAQTSQLLNAVFWVVFWLNQSWFLVVLLGTMDTQGDRRLLPNLKACARFLLKTGRELNRQVLQQCRGKRGVADNNVENNRALFAPEPVVATMWQCMELGLLNNFIMLIVSEHIKGNMCRGCHPHLDVCFKPDGQNWSWLAVDAIVVLTLWAMHFRKEALMSALTSVFFSRKRSQEMKDDLLPPADAAADSSAGDGGALEAGAPAQGWV